MDGKLNYPNQRSLRTASPPENRIVLQNHDMKKQYLIEWKIPKNYNPAKVLNRLPSPISSDIREIYNYCIKPNGFYFLDNGIESAVAGDAFKLFVDEALRHCKHIIVKDISVKVKSEKRAEQGAPGYRR
jgi:hypothetical protein